MNRMRMRGFLAGRRLPSTSTTTRFVAGSRSLSTSSSPAPSPPVPTSASPEELERRYLVPNYWPDGVRGEPGLLFEQGKGCELIASDGRTFLDFMSGIAVNALGHSDPAWVDAVRDQAARIAHTSNLFHTGPPLALAKRLVELSPDGIEKVFLCNSGTEANEAALKFATRLAQRRAEPKKEGGDGTQKALAGRILAFTGNFHGRTMGSLSITHKPAIREPFFNDGGCMMGIPHPPSSSSSSPSSCHTAKATKACCERVTFLPFNDSAALRNEMDESVAAVIVEPIQGEGGVNPASSEWLAEMRRLCDTFGTALIADEVQCGLGRIGSLFASERYAELTAGAFRPDMITLAKPLAGGLPIGAVLCSDEVASSISPGDHGSTFGGGPLVAQAALSVLDRLTAPNFLEEVNRKGKYLEERARNLQQELKNKGGGEGEGDGGEKGYITAVRSAGGLFVGVELAEAPGPVIQKARENGVLFISCGATTIRLVPPLIVSDEECQRAFDVLEEAIKERANEYYTAAAAAAAPAEQEKEQSI